MNEPKKQEAVMKVNHKSPESYLSAADRKGNGVIQSAIKNGPLVQGNREAAVRWMERMLKLAGFNPGPVDQNFSQNTTAALQSFQTSVGLPATGQLDQATFAKLKGVEIRVRSHKDEFLGVGQKDSRVLTAEKELKRLGYDVGTVDGVFDAKDGQAIREFRGDEGKAWGKSTFLGAGVDAKLKQEFKAVQHEAYRARVKPTREHRRLDALTATQVAQTKPDGSMGLGLGDKSRAVQNIQARLKAAGFDPMRTGGVFDERTAGAVENFQRQSGLTVTGHVDPQTWRKLSKSFVYANTGFGPRQALLERDGAVARTQQALKNDGYRVRTDGLFDSGTQKAVKDFERHHHLKVDGQVDQKEFAAIKKGDRPHPTGELGRVYRDNESKAERAKFSAHYRGEVNSVMSEVKQHWSTIQKLANKADLPPGLVAGIWYRESSFNEHTYLQNGDPLGSPTTHVPRGIYFGKHQFVEAATAALNSLHWLKNDLKLHYGSTDKGAIATFAEYYNGLGYRSHGRASPYVYAGTDQYHGGMYVADGVFSAGTYDQRVGVLAVANAIQRHYGVD
jgi:peptidoglycan hydrolase-like protein with peptidoglycan-binding domain/lysozyme family protein